MAGVPIPYVRPSATADSAADTAEAALIQAGRCLEAAGLVRARSGNASVRRGDGLCITTTGARLGNLGPQDFASLPLTGPCASGRRPSSELPMHALIYRTRPDVCAILHTHSPFSTAWASIEDVLDLRLEEAAYYRMGTISPVIAPLPAGSRSLAEAVAEQLRDHATVLLRDHGAVIAAATLEDAIDTALSLEHQAQVAWIVRSAHR